MGESIVAGRDPFLLRRKMLFLRGSIVAGGKLLLLSGRGGDKG